MVSMGTSGQTNPPSEEGHMGMCHTWKPLWHYQSLPGSEGVRKKETSKGAQGKREQEEIEAAAH